MLATLFLVVLGLITPTFLDRSDIDLDTNEVLVQRRVTQQPLFNGGGFFEATLEVQQFEVFGGVAPTNDIASIGLVNELTASYEPDANNILRYQPVWLIRACVSPILGLVVLNQSGQVIYVQNNAYDPETVVVRVQRVGDWIDYYMNEQLVDSFYVQGNGSMRGYVQNPVFFSSFVLERGDILNTHEALITTEDSLPVLGTALSLSKFGNH